MLHLDGSDDLALASAWDEVRIAAQKLVVVNNEKSVLESDTITQIQIIRSPGCIDSPLLGVQVRLKSWMKRAVGAKKSRPPPSTATSSSRPTHVGNNKNTKPCSRWYERQPASRPGPVLSAEV
eukprot:COSAG02_NODE_6565_length_3492_cov_1.855585_2_plen_123_part_00